MPRKFWNGLLATCHSVGSISTLQRLGFVSNHFSALMKTVVRVTELITGEKKYITKSIDSCYYLTFRQQFRWIDEKLLVTFLQKAKWISSRNIFLYQYEPTYNYCYSSSMWKDRRKKEMMPGCVMCYRLWRFFLFRRRLRCLFSCNWKFSFYEGKECLIKSNKIVFIALTAGR